MLIGAALYRTAFEHEIYANHAMLKMLAGVPEANRSDPLFQRAVSIAAHMATCREDFLALFLGERLTFREPFGILSEVASLEERFMNWEARWKEYLANLDEARIDGTFDFQDSGHTWRMSLEAQLFQLIGHAAYHRGQVVLLVDMLGGESVDTDFVDWYCAANPSSWSMVD